MHAGTAQLGTYLGNQSSSQNDLLLACLQRAQSAIDTYTRRTFEATTGTLYYHQYAARIAGQVLYLDQDVLGVQTLVNGNGQTITAISSNSYPPNGYYLEPANLGPPYTSIRLGFNYPWVFNVDQRIVVAGTIGYSSTAPYDIQQACIRWAAYLYKQRDAQVFEVTAEPSLGVINIPVGIPKDVEILLRPYRRTYP